jgi:hypothetical protein
LRCRSCAFMTSSAVMPWSGRSHGPPNCLHVMVFVEEPVMVTPGVVGHIDPVGLSGLKTNRKYVGCPRRCHQ